jgi:hypothetical protein
MTPCPARRAVLDRSTVAVVARSSVVDPITVTVAARVTSQSSATRNTNVTFP